MKRRITIGRQFGAGGREIGETVAKRLEIAYYDTELLQVAASESGLDQNFLNSYDETGRRSLLYSLVMGTSGPLSIFENNSTTEILADQAYREAVKRVAQENSCVIVGRCADYILRKYENVLRVFICAEDTERMKRICEQENLDEQEAIQKMKQMDKARKSYYNYNTDCEWGAAKSYDLCINVSKVGAEGAVEQILCYLASMENVTSK